MNKNLEKIRDEESSDLTNHDAYMFDAGFDYAVSLLLPELEAARDALKKIRIDANPGASRNEWLCFSASGEALTRLDKFMGEK